MTKPDPARGAEADVSAAAGPNLNVGGFRFWFVGQRWEWSDEVARMHGYEPGTVAPTTKLLLSHKHPDDYRHVLGALEDTRRPRAVFSTRHRMIDTAGNEHLIVVVGAQLRDDAGTVVGKLEGDPNMVRGYYDVLRQRFNVANPETGLYFDQDWGPMPAVMPAHA